MFDKIPAQALSDTVAQQIQLQIEKGSFVKSGKLPTEAVLAQEFGVSRTVIREAISRLKNEGMVEPRQGSGVFIVERAGIRPLRIDYAQAVEPGAVVQILALRRAIEAEVASEAAMRRTDAQMDVIEAKLAQIDVAVAQGEDGVTEDVEFHRAIASATGNPYFLTTLAFLNQYPRPARSLRAATNRCEKTFRGRSARNTRGSRLPFAQATPWLRAMPRRPTFTTPPAASQKPAFADQLIGRITKCPETWE